MSFVWSVHTDVDEDSRHYGEKIIAYLRFEARLDYRDHAYGIYKTERGWFFGSATYTEERITPNFGPFETPEAVLAYARLVT